MITPADDRAIDAAQKKLYSALSLLDQAAANIDAVGFKTDKAAHVHAIAKGAAAHLRQLINDNLY